MEPHSVTTDLKRLITTIRQENTGRHRHLQHLHNLIGTLKSKGVPVPPEATRLESVLREEAVEEQFDNLPV